MSVLTPPGLDRTSRERSAWEIQESLCGVLADLYERQIALQPKRGYLRIHSASAFVRDQVRAFAWYTPFLPQAGTVLDWGCKHAPDSCLLRARFGDRFQLHGCDFDEPGLYAAFHQHAGLDYMQLSDPFVLPYEAGMFDVVIGAGALEHTAMDYEALKQLYRVLKPGGTLVIYYLPNRLSVQEWYWRTIRKAAFHRRLYGLGETLELLKHAGFYPLDSGYHFLFWTRPLKVFGDGPWVETWAQRLTRLVPLGVFGDTLRIVAEKRAFM